MEDLSLTINLNFPSGLKAGYYKDPATSTSFYYDGTNWYMLENGQKIMLPLGIESTGYQYSALAYENPPTVYPGNTVAVHVTYNYIGPVVTGLKQYIALGSSMLSVFTDKIANSDPPEGQDPPLSITGITNNNDGTNNYIRNLPRCNIATLHGFIWTFTIPSNVESNWNAIFVKLYDGTPQVAGRLTIEVPNCLSMLGLNKKLTPTSVNLLKV